MPKRQANDLVLIWKKQFWYALPKKIYGANIDKINELQKTGLGLLKYCW
jgi:hypothetical protein